jgi:hypothetical protein
MHRIRILHSLLALLTLIGVGSVFYLSPAGPAGALGGADSTITSTTNPTSVVSGQPVALEVTVSGSDGTPTGTVTFTEENPNDSGDYTLCVATLQDGSGSCTATNLTAEPAASTPPTTIVEANYSGDDNYSANRGSLFVNASFAATSIALQSSPNPNLPDTVFTVTANVTVNSPGSYTNVVQGNVYVQFEISGYDNPYSGTTCNGPLDVSSTPMTSTCSFNFPAGSYIVTAQLVNGQLGGVASPIDPPSLTESVQPPAHGYWLVGSDGGIFTFGSAQFYGSTGNLKLQRPVVGITPTADRGGYWLVASDGGVFSFGDTQFYGSIPGIGISPAGSGLPHSLNAPIVGIVPSVDDGGYFMVASDGGVFAFGDAQFEGSCPGIGGCSGAAVAVVPDASGKGYWLVTATGHVYAFGDAANYGQPGPQSVPVTSAARTPDGKGYWILLSNGDPYTYGDAQNYGNCSLIGGCSGSASAFIPDDTKGYWIATSTGNVYAFGDAPNDGSMAGKHLNGAIIAGVGF